MQTTDQPNARSGRHRASLRFKMAITIAGVSATVIVSFGLVSYGEMRWAAIRASSDRLQSVTRQLAGMLATSGSTLRTTLAAAAQDPAIRTYARHPAGSLERDALAVLAPLTKPAAAIADVELWSADGRRLLTTSPAVAALPAAASAAVVASLSAGQPSAVGRFIADGKSVGYPIVARITDAEGVVGFVVQRRRLSGASNEGQQLRFMIGSGAQIFAGNRGGDVWTDFAVRVDPPPLVARGETNTGRVSQYRRAATGAMLATTEPIAGTPWALLIEFPRADALRHVHSVLWGIITLALIILLVAAIVGWRLSRRFTRPLAELGAAAEAISAGDYSHRLDASRSDEVGAVAEAFNRMNESIMTGRAALQSKAEEAAASERRLQGVIASSGAVLYELRVGERDVALDWMSDSVTRMLGYSIDDARSPSWWIDNLHPADRDGLHDRVFAGRKSSAEADAHSVREYRFRDALGKYHWVRDEQRVFRGNGNGNGNGKGTTASASGATTTRVVGAWLDISEQRNLEEQYRHAQKMEAVGTLAGGVAHDFNNLLTVIMSYATLHLAAHKDDADADDLEEIVAATRRATALTRQLLTFSRKAIVQRQPVNVSAVVADMEGMLRRLMTVHVKLVTRLSPDLGIVLADPSQIEQILMNLVVNANDAMPEGGTLAIETQNVQLDADYARAHAEVQPGPYIMLAVTDTGVGIDATTLEKIFEPFFTTKEVGRGTGLGLATVYAIAKQLGGHVWVYSEPGHGAAFKIYLPQSAARLHPDEKRLSRRPTPRGGTALLVEDDETVRKAVRRMLERLGYGVLEAPDGEAGLGIAAAHQGTLNVVVTDLMMPRMNGGEFATKLVASRPDVRVVFTSGYTDDAVIRRGLVSPAHVFLQKPFTGEQLAAAIKTLADLEQPAPHIGIATPYHSNGQPRK
jgi:signal transduction histidine kinase/CheY-like chemotaxis protein